jgi:hypothetical protein
MSLDVGVRSQGGSRAGQDRAIAQGRRQSRQDDG